MLVSLNFARMIVKRAIRKSINGETVNLPVVMKAIDALGDGDGNVELSDVITAVSDYVSDIGNEIAAVAQHCPKLLENAGIPVADFLSNIGNTIGNIPDVASKLADSAGEIISDLADNAGDVASDVIDGIYRCLGGHILSMRHWLSFLLNSFRDFNLLKYTNYGLQL